MPSNSNANCLENIQPNQAVRAVLVMLQAYHECELEKLKRVLADENSSLTKKLEKIWTQLATTSTDQTDALGALTQHVVLQLERESLEF